MTLECGSLVRWKNSWPIKHLFCVLNRRPVSVNEECAYSRFSLTLPCPGYASVLSTRSREA